MTPIVITDATAEPLVVSDIVAHSVLNSNDDWELIEAYIRAARASVENYINATVSPKTLEIALPSFAACAGAISLPLGPVQSVVSVTYTDADGAQQTLDTADYVLDRYCRPQALRLAYGASWPSTRAQFDAVKIRYVAGYDFNDSPSFMAIPPEVLQAMRLQVGHMLENREAVATDTLAELPLGIKYLLDPCRMEMGV